MSVEPISLSRELVDKVRQVANGESVEAFVNQAVEERLALLRAQQTKRDAEAFEQMRPLLMQRYAGQFVAIRDGAVVDSDADLNRLRERVHTQFGDAPVFIKGVATIPALDALDLNEWLQQDDPQAPASLKDATIPLRVDDDQVVRVGRTRIPLQAVIDTFNEGASPEEIVLRFSSLHLADLYAVIGWYLQNRQEVDAYLRQRQQQREGLREQILQYSDARGIRDQLLARRAEQQVQPHG